MEENTHGEVELSCESECNNRYPDQDKMNQKIAIDIHIETNWDWLLCIYVFVAALAALYLHVLNGWVGD